MRPFSHAGGLCVNAQGKDPREKGVFPVLERCERDWGDKVGMRFKKRPSRRRKPPMPYRGFA